MAKEAKELADQGTRIAELREERGRAQGRRVPQPEVADAVGVTLRAYQVWEAGAGDIDPKNLKALADYFGVTADYIEYGELERTRTPDPFASADIAAKLDRIGEQVSELHALLLGEDRDDSEVVVGIAARLLQAAGLPPTQDVDQTRTPRAGSRRRSA